MDGSFRVRTADFANSLKHFLSKSFTAPIKLLIGGSFCDYSKQCEFGLSMASL